MNKRIILILIGVILIVVVISLFFINTQEEVRSCRDIGTNSPELTFEASYCLGDQCAIICDTNGGNCRNVRTREECESIDVISEDLGSGKDGRPDCVWVGDINPEDPCKPNK